MHVPSATPSSPSSPLPHLPDIVDVASLPDSDLITLLDLLFEPSPALHTLCIPVARSAATICTSYADLVDALRAQLLALHHHACDDPAARVSLLSILQSHPRLGEKKVASAQSAAEQAQLRSSSGDGVEEELKELARLNTEYEATFPGLRYVTFVNGRGRGVIMQNMRERISRADTGSEEREAIEAMCDIARDRVKKLQALEA